MKTATKNSKTTKQTKAPKTEKLPQLFQGKIQASKLFVRELEGFSKKQGNGCPAKMWLAFNEQEGTVTVCNTYREDNQPKASWNPETYTYLYKPAVHDKKMDAMTEVDVTEYPEWVEHAAARKRSKK